MMVCMKTAAAHLAAPATELVATNCAVCGRALVDAESVECGVGPECREKYGYSRRDVLPAWEAVDRALVGTPAATEILGWVCDARTIANKLVARIAVDRKGEHAGRYTAAVWALGYRTLAGKVAARIGVVRVAPTADGTQLEVRAPFLASFAPALRLAGVSSEWNGMRRVRLVPAAARVGLWRALGSSYGPGTLVEGPKGLAVL